MVLAGCGSEPQPTPTPDIPETVSAAVAEALGTPIAHPTVSPTAIPTPKPVTSAPIGTPDIEATINAAIAIHTLSENPESLEFWAIASTEDARQRLEVHPEAINAKDEDGRTPLNVAASSNPNVEVTALLLDRRGRFPANILHKAVYNTDPEVVALLLGVGADIMAEDRLVGWTPLHTAAWDCCNTSVISLLLEHGADIEAEDALGRTACQMAMKPRPVGTTTCNRNAVANIRLLCR